MDRPRRSRVGRLMGLLGVLAIVAGCGSAAPSGSQIAAAESATPGAFTAAPLPTVTAPAGATPTAATAASPDQPTLFPGGQTLTWASVLSSDGGSALGTKLGGISDAVAFGDGFVLSGSENEGQHAVIWYSQDGVSWQAIDNVPGFADGVIRTVVAAGDGLVAVGTAFGLDSRCAADATDCNPGSAIRLWISPDGRNWRGLSAAALKPFGRAQLEVVVPGPAGLVAFGQLVPTTGDRISPMMWISPDGRSWSAAPQFGRAFPSDTVIDLAAGANGYVAAGALWVGGNMGRPRKAWYSADGRTWQVASGLINGEGPSVVLACAGGYVGIDAPSGSAAFWTSLDGRSWALQPEVLNRPDYPVHLGMGVYSDGRRILAIGSDSYQTSEAWLSGDGRDWRPYTLGGKRPAADSAVVGALGARGVVVATTTPGSPGQTWTIWFGTLSG